MCGIVGGVTRKDNITPILLEGLKRLEYRGYDSAGLAVIDGENTLHCIRAVGKVASLENSINGHAPVGRIGIAHTRWATHGKPTENNAHPHISHNKVALVHNGIIENFETLRSLYRDSGYVFYTETDTEVVVHCIHHHLNQTGSLLSAVQKAAVELEGAYAIAALTTDDPDHIVVARKGSPLVIGVGKREHFIASDPLALLPVSKRFICLEEGDVADVSQLSVTVYDSKGQIVNRPILEFNLQQESADKGTYRHFMQKEIFEQPQAVKNTLEGRTSPTGLFDNAFGTNAGTLFNQVKSVHIAACGTSYHAGLVARYWFEELAKTPCVVEIASEYRYRTVFIPEGCLFVTLSQSGETADTLATLRLAKLKSYLTTLAICNVPASSLVRESDLVWMMRVGPEIGVASTKAFMAQLVSLLILAILLGKRRGLDRAVVSRTAGALSRLPEWLLATLELNLHIEKMAQCFIEKDNALFLGRGVLFPIALEGALKLKEISYIHAEGYPAGELKHGPLALVDSNMPVVALAPQSELLEKLKSNLQEVRARGGQLFIFACKGSGITEDENTTVLELPPHDALLAPMVYTLVLQLLAYHVAVLKGTDVDQPRNLAKSVTVE